VRVAGEGGDLGAEGLGVEGERLLGLALEVEVRVYAGHWLLLPRRTRRASAVSSASADARPRANLALPGDARQVRGRERPGRSRPRRQLAQLYGVPGG